MWLAVEHDLVPGAGRLRLEVGAVELGRRNHERDATAHAGAELFQLHDLVRIVGHQMDRGHVQTRQHVGRDRVVALVITEPEGQVGFHGIEPSVLERIGAHLVEDADAPALVPQVEHRSTVGLADEREGAVQLLAAVAAQRAEGIAGKTLGVQPDKHGSLATQVAAGEHDHLGRAVAHDADPEVARSGRQHRLRVELVGVCHRTPRLQPTCQLAGKLRGV